jgi:hypothetical protein
MVEFAQNRCEQQIKECADFVKLNRGIILSEKVGRTKNVCVK